MLEQRIPGEAEASRYDFQNGLLGECVPKVGTFVCLLLLVLGCGTPVPPSPVTVCTLSIRSLYPEALKTAKEWKEDAYLVGAETSFWEDGTNGYQSAYFSFRSPSTDIVGLAVWYDPATGSFRDEWLSIAKEHPERKSQIKDSDWRTDSTEVLELAQSHGGQEFLTGRSANDLHQYLRLDKRQENGQLLTVWFVAYYDQTMGEHLFVVVDALSGEVIETTNTK